MQIHTWYTRARCECGFIWTTEPLGSVVCQCGALQIDGADVSGAPLFFTEEEFNQAVAADFGLTVDEIIVEHGGT